jgi:hypothetical protein
MKRLVLGCSLLFVEGAIAQTLQMYRHPDSIQIYYTPQDRLNGVKRSAYQAYVIGLPPNLPVEYEYNIQEQKEVISDACGGLRIKYQGNESINVSLPFLQGAFTPNVVLPPGVQPFQLFGGSVIPASYPKGLIPKCKNGQWEVAPTGAVRTDTEVFFPNGIRQFNEPKIILPSTRYIVTRYRTVKRRLVANACGVVLIRGLLNNQGWKINGQVFNVFADTPAKRFFCQRGKLFEMVADVIPRPPQSPVGIAPSDTPTVPGQPIIPPPSNPDPDNSGNPVGVQPDGRYWDGTNFYDLVSLQELQSMDLVNMRLRSNRELSPTSPYWYNRPDTPPGGWAYTTSGSFNYLFDINTGEYYLHRVYVVFSSGIQLYEFMITVPDSWL